MGRFAAGPAPEADTLLALPLVGAVVGALAGGLGLVASLVAPPPVAAAVAFAGLVVFSGAIHIDGFLDGCDAFFAAVAPERRLEILKDPRHGTFAVAGMWLAGSLAVAALAALPAPAFPGVLAFTGALARLAAVANAYVYPSARGAAGARALVTRPALWPLLAQGAILGAIAATVALPLAAVVPIAVGIALACGGAIVRRLGGGLVGDAYGFVVVVVETGALVIASTAGGYFR